MDGLEVYPFEAQKPPGLKGFAPQVLKQTPTKKTTKLRNGLPDHDAGTPQSVFLGKPNRAIELPSSFSHSSPPTALLRRTLLLIFFPPFSLPLHPSPPLPPLRTSYPPLFSHHVSLTFSTSPSPPPYTQTPHNSFLTYILVAQHIPSTNLRPSYTFPARE